jgi:DNA repair and recombination RAD54-like protein
MRRKAPVNIHSLYDPNADDAFVVYRPKKVLSEAEKLAYVGANPGKTPTFEVEVVIDPILAKVLRPHQKEGVKFLYECTTGRKSEGAFGCIMADEMGLGKTLQCITLLWTLLRQSEIPGKPTIEKAIIACPSSLVKNWANELEKWLGQGRVRPYSCDNKGTKEQTNKDICQFVAAKGRGVVNPGIFSFI